MKTIPSNQFKTVILSAPQGWGKSVKSEQLRAAHHCKCVVDGWWPGDKIVENALHLTHAHPQRVGVQQGAQVVSYGWT